MGCHLLTQRSDIEARQPQPLVELAIANSTTGTELAWFNQVSGEQLDLVHSDYMPFATFLF
jgi:hypothetical protein